MAHEAIKFQVLESAVEVSFWNELADRKLDTYQLSEETVAIHGSTGASQNVGTSTPVQCDAGSFLAPEAQKRAPRVPVGGRMFLANTKEGFAAWDRKGAVEAMAAGVWEAIVDGSADADPTLLCPLLLAAQADLKAFRFTYWFAFPALKPPKPFASTTSQLLSEAVSEPAARALCAAGDAALSAGAPLVWLTRLSGDDAEMRPLNDWESVGAEEGARWFLTLPDPGHLLEYPSWPLRNVLMWAAHKKLPKVEVLCLRGSAGRCSPSRSLYLEVDLTTARLCESYAPVPVYPGSWEKNGAGKFAPRSVHLGRSMDPRALAEQAVDLNLRLMKWRAAPGVRLKKLQDMRCLLFGAGTLGCAVARTLLGWGVRRVTFVDSSRVSYSNPVRQSLYTFSDCLEGGKPKAAAAAAALRAVFPGVEAEGLELAVPMPGHPPPPAELEATRAAAMRLGELVAASDVVFLLMDTRESRWLPSLLAAAHGVPAINAALGFDSYVVSRHGAGPGAGAGHQRLGCYFCNDVVAPLNSTIDRSLDQQCTVARPGLAPIAGALAVEMAAALSQHPLGINAPPDDAPEAAALGGVPHMVRGSMNGFTQTKLTGHAFPQCTACSPAAVDAYRARGWEFVLEVLERPAYLEDLTGLKALHDEAAARLAAMALDDDDDEGGDGGEDDGDVGEDDWTEL